LPAANTPKPKPTPAISISEFIAGDVGSGQIVAQTKVQIACYGATLTYQGTPKQAAVQATSITSNPKDQNGFFHWTFLFKWATQTPAPSPPTRGTWLFNATCTSPNAPIEASKTFTV
jgi:hypothetical protein